MLWRGTVLLLIGQLLALLSGYGINVFLARRLGPADFGTFGVVYGILMIIELCVVAGIPNALQRFVGENPNHSFSLHKYLFKRQLFYAFLFLGITFLIAPLLAKLFKDPIISYFLRIAIFDVVVFGLYWYYNGFPLGQRQFGRHTIIVAGYSIFKFIFVVGLVSGGLSIAGALIGNILGSSTGMILGIFLLKINKEEQSVEYSDSSGAILSLKNCSTEHNFKVEERYFQAFSSKDDKIYLGDLHMKASLYEHQKSGDMGVIHNHPFFLNIDMEEADPVGFMQMIGEPGKLGQQFYYRPEIFE